MLTPTANGFPWLATAEWVARSINQLELAPLTRCAAGDIPYFVMHLDHPSRRIRLEAFGAATRHRPGIVSATIST